MKAQRHRGTKAQSFLREIAVAVCCLLLLGRAGAYAGDTTVPLGESDLLIAVSGVSTVTGDRILLGEMAKITGGSEAFRGELADIDLGPAPRPGQERQITGMSIAVAIEKAAGDRVRGHISAPSKVVARGACQNLSEASLEAAFREYVADGVGGDAVILRDIKVRGLAPLPMGKVVLTPSTHQKGEIKGKTILRLAVSVAGESCGQVTVSGWVDRYSQVVCAAREVPRDTILTEEDVCLKRINIAEAPDSLVFDVADAVGKRVRSTLRDGKCLQQHKLFEVPLVEKGDRVKLLVSTGPVAISTLGIAQADGGTGDQIRVENVSSQKTVVGRILDASTVEVIF